MAKKPQKKPQKPADFLKYVDRPDLPETYADELRGFLFDGNILKVELVTYQWDIPEGQQQPSGKKYPVAQTGPFSTSG